MNPPDPSSRAPGRISVPGKPALTLDPEHLALHGLAEAVPGAVLSFADEGIAVVRGAPPAEGGGRPGPVYRLEPGGALAVPTGRVFVRFAGGITAGERAEALRRAGYEVAEVPDYAPHAAWLRPLSGEVADALAGVERVAALPGVEGVEPQLLLERGPRG